jgi:hypothetical protein
MNAVSLTALFFSGIDICRMGEWRQSQGRRNDHFRTGGTLIAKSAEESVTVVLTDDTVTKDKTGLFGLTRRNYPAWC